MALSHCFIPKLEESLVLFQSQFRRLGGKGEEGNRFLWCVLWVFSFVLQKLVGKLDKDSVSLEKLSK